MPDYGARPLYIKFNGQSSSIGNMYAPDTYLIMGTMDLFNDFFAGKFDRFMQIKSASSADLIIAFILNPSSTTIFPSGGATGVSFYQSHIVIDGYTMFYLVIT